MAQLDAPIAGGEPEQEPHAIKTMKLYSSFARIDNELKELGVPIDAPLDAPMLFPFDSLHYEGTAAVDAAIAAISDSPTRSTTTTVLDIGSGVGGPARYLAHKGAYSVAALELQPDADAKARELTGRCGLLLNKTSASEGEGEGDGGPSDSTPAPAEALARGGVWHACGDVMCDFDEVTATLAAIGAPAAKGAYDAVASWLTFLHIEDKHALLARCAEFTRAGGLLYVEDFYAKTHFTEAEKQSLMKDVYCAALPTEKEYCAALVEAGYELIRFEDRTLPWCDYVCERLAAFKGDADRHKRVHGECLYGELHEFYSAMASLFQGGRLGGVRLVARKL